MQQTINLIFPKSWNKLTDKHLLLLFTLLADGYPATDIKVKCLLKWTGTKVIGCIEGKQYFARTFPHFLQPTANTDTVFVVLLHLFQ